MGKLLVFDHPLIQHKVSMMRKVQTTTKEFKELAKEVVMLMGYEATRLSRKSRSRLLSARPDRTCLRARTSPSFPS